MGASAIIGDKVSSRVANVPASCRERRSQGTSIRRFSPARAIHVDPCPSHAGYPGRGISSRIRGTLQRGKHHARRTSSCAWLRGASRCRTTRKQSTTFPSVRTHVRASHGIRTYGVAIEDRADRGTVHGEARQKFVNRGGKRGNSPTRI